MTILIIDHSSYPKLTEWIVNIIEALPAITIDKIAKNVLFALWNPDKADGWTFYDLHEDFPERAIIIISTKTREPLNCVAHELAHYLKGHNFIRGDENDPQIIAYGAEKEKEADEFAETIKNQYWAKYGKNA